MTARRSLRSGYPTAYRSAASRHPGFQRDVAATAAARENRNYRYVSPTAFAAPLEQTAMNALLKSPYVRAALLGFAAVFSPEDFFYFPDTSGTATKPGGAGWVKIRGDWFYGGYAADQGWQLGDTESPISGQGWDIHAYPMPLGGPSRVMSVGEYREDGLAFPALPAGYAVVGINSVWDRANPGTSTWDYFQPHPEFQFQPSTRLNPWQNPFRQGIFAPEPIPFAPPYRMLPDLPSAPHRETGPGRVRRPLWVAPQTFPGERKLLDAITGARGRVRRYQGQRPIIGIGVQNEVIRARTHQPPKKGDREQKQSAKKGAVRIFTEAIINGYTEGMDVVWSLYFAIPARERRKLIPAGQKFTRLDQVPKIVAQNLAKVNWQKAINNLVNNEIEDQIIGRLSKAAGKAYRKDMAKYQPFDRPTGLGVTGPTKKASALGGEYVKGQLRAARYAERGEKFKAWNLARYYRNGKPLAGRPSVR